PDARKSVVVGRGVNIQPDTPITKEFVDAVGDRMLTLDPTVPLSKVAAAELVVGSPVPGKRGIVVGKIVSFTPITLEQFRAFAANIERGLSMTDLDARADRPFTTARMAARLKTTGLNLKEDAPDEAVDESEMDAQPN
ncbi:MAG: hypothetical protein ACT4PL_02705, partial [Phycisphaerales bacterium]